MLSGAVLLCTPCSQHPCVSTVTPMQFCLSYKSADGHQQCRATLPRTENMLPVAALLCKPCSQHPDVSTMTPMQFCLSYSLSSVTLAASHCNSVQLRLHAVLHSAAVQNRLTAAWRPCISFCAVLLVTLVWSNLIARRCKPAHWLRQSCSNLKHPAYSGTQNLLLSNLLT